MDSILRSCKDRSVKVVCKLLAAVALVLVQGVYALDPSGQPTTRTVPKHSKISCPSKNFSVFIRKFVDNEAIQRAFTQYPLRKQYLDVTAEPEPKFFTRYLKRHRIHFPVLLNDNELKAYGLISHSERVSKDTFSVIESSAGEKCLGCYIEYKFKFRKGCWFLSEIIDGST